MTANAQNPAPPQLQRGDRIDKFEIIEQIGAGGMSIVWKAYDKLLDRHVAIKQILPDRSGNQDDGELRERFRREVQTQKRLGQTHKHLVRVFDVIEDNRGLFIVMEYVDGPSLEQILATNRKPMDERQALGIVGAAALGLEAIHAADVIHRDLKPANLLLPRNGGLKVTDFGLATLVAEQDAMSLGSVRYMAPELFREEPVDRRADLYALGMIAYEMLAGRDAFEEAFRIVLRDQRNQSLRWMKWHTNLRAKAPPLREINPKISATLSDLVGRLMEKDPASRIQSATELLEAIRRHFAVSSEPEIRAPRVSPSPTASANPTAPLPKRSLLVPILVGIILLQLIGGGGYFLYRAQQKKSAVTQARNNALLIYRDAQADYARKDYRAAEEKFTMLAQAWPNDPTLDRDAKAWAIRCSGHLFFEAKQFEKARDAFEEADKAAVFAKDRDTLRQLMTQASNAAAFANIRNQIDKLITEGKYADARQQIADLRATRPTEAELRILDGLAERNEDQDARARVTNLIARANKLTAQDNRDGAIKLLEDSKRTFSSGAVNQLLDQLKEDRTFDQTVAEARKAEDANKPQEAIAAYRRAMGIRQDAKLKDRIDHIRSDLALREGRELKRAGKLDEARAKFIQALKVENPEAAAELKSIETANQKSAFLAAAKAAVSAGDFETAISQFDNALRFGPDPAIEADKRAARVRFYVKQSKDYMTQGQYDQARAALAEARKIESNDPEAKKIGESLGRRAEYQKHIDAGDAFARESNLDDAKFEYLRAREIADTKEVRAKIDDTEYAQLIARTKRFMATENWSGARSLLQTIARTRMNDEVRQLMAEVDKADPPKDSEK
ncbi:MAG: protein kinase [Phycisphaeraceae bacterium]|nr:protein kinase [Phycisphaeraceae bacterium]